MRTELQKLIEHAVSYDMGPEDLSRLAEISLEESKEILTKKDYAWVRKETESILTVRSMTDTEACIRNRVLEKDHPYQWVLVVDGN